ncbi:hypothetical protein HZA96_03355 [Candidatus Woesearchaeota archaeon]|nr:hypothetical protein [Candidatus Woesearchaeota archaeon]
MLTKEQIIKRLEKNKTEIKSFGVRKLELFGSFARNEQKHNLIKEELKESILKGEKIAAKI